MNEQRRVIVSTPENSETPLEEVQGWVTPNRLFFVRTHFQVPTLDRREWRLKIEGCLGRELELSWEDLERMPQRTVFATLECAGNGRSFLEPRVDGVPWGAGAIGHAEWTGVPLERVLKQAGLAPEAIEIVFEGADRGREKGQTEELPFAHGISVEKALHPDTLLATRMNGELLEPSHGAPVRLLVPGWCGVASVKWLTRIEAVNRPFEGFFQNKYSIQRASGRGTAREVIGAMPVKSEINRPRAGEVLGVGTNRVVGLAWSGEDGVEAVELSLDGGHSWSRADLLGPRAPYSWCLWEYLWEVASPGEHTLLSRAISSSGQIQPTRHDPLRGGYLINFSRPLSVRVDPGRISHESTGDARSLRDEMHALAEERSRVRLDVEMEFSYGAGI